MSAEKDLFVPASEKDEGESVGWSAWIESGAVIGDKSIEKKLPIKMVKKSSRSNPIERIKIKALPMTCCVWYCKEKTAISNKYCKIHQQGFEALQLQAARTGTLTIQAKLVGDFEKASSALTQFWECTVHQCCSQRAFDRGMDCKSINLFSKCAICD